MSEQYRHDCRPKIEVMQAWLAGNPIQRRLHNFGAWESTNNPRWNWAECDYRIAPEHPTAPEPGEGWRLLEKGERVVEGDEVWHIDEYWCESSAPQHGHGRQGEGLTYRRRTAPEPGEGCRLLREDEPLQPGDEMWNYSYKAWEPSRNAETGSKRSPICTYRRRIAQEPDKDWKTEPPEGGFITGKGYWATNRSTSGKLSVTSLLGLTIQKWWKGQGMYPETIAWMERGAHDRPPEPYQPEEATEPAPEPQWHDDAPPTVEQVPDDVKCWITTRGGTVAAWGGHLVRRYFSDCDSHDPIAWMEIQDQPAPYRPYQPPATWQKTSERPPTEADGRGTSYVACKDSFGALIRAPWYDVAKRPDAFVEWIPTAALLSACRD